MEKKPEEHEQRFWPYYPDKYDILHRVKADISSTHGCIFEELVEDCIALDVHRFEYSDDDWRYYRARVSIDIDRLLVFMEKVHKQRLANSFRGMDRSLPAELSPTLPRKPEFHFRWAQRKSLDNSPPSVS